MLLFVHDDETEALELDALGKQRMRADDDIDGAFGQRGLCLLRLLRVDEARKLADLQREAFEAFAEASEMLPREERGGHDDSELLASHRGDERGAQRYFRFAEPDVAATEAIHRLAFGEILDDVGDGFFLVVRLLIRKARGKFVIDALRRIDLRHGAKRTRGSDLDEFGGHLP